MSKFPICKWSFCFREVDFGVEIIKQQQPCEKCSPACKFCKDIIEVVTCPMTEEKILGIPWNDGTWPWKLTANVVLGIWNNNVPRPIHQKNCTQIAWNPYAPLGSPEIRTTKTLSSYGTSNGFHNRLDPAIPDVGPYDGGPYVGLVTSARAWTVLLRADAHGIPNLWLEVIWVNHSRLAGQVAQQIYFVTPGNILDISNIATKLLHFCNGKYINI